MKCGDSGVKKGTQNCTAAPSIRSIFCQKSKSNWFWLTSLCGWLGVLLLAAAVCLPRFRSFRPGLFVGGAFFLALAGAGFYGLHAWESRLDLPNQAVIVAKNSLARSGPVPDAEPIIELPPGSAVRVVRSRGPWQYVDIPGGLRGWVHGSELEVIWPMPPSNAPAGA